MHPNANTQPIRSATAIERRLEAERIARANEERARNRGYIVFATDPKLSSADPGYCEIYATEAKTSKQAAAKVRATAPGRRLHAYLATGKYRHELPEALWVL